MCSRATLWLEARPIRESNEQGLRAEPQTAFTRHIASYHLIGNVRSPTGSQPGSVTTDLEPMWSMRTRRRPNLSPAAQLYLDTPRMLNVEDLFHHVIAVLHDPAYREANAGALRMEWPRIPLPGWPDGDEDGAADDLAASAARGRELAALLDSDTPVPGVTKPLPGAPAGSALRPEIATVAVPSVTGGGNMIGEDFALAAGWGHFGQGRGRHARPGPRSRAPLHRIRARRPGPKPPPPSAATHPTQTTAPGRAARQPRLFRLFPPARSTRRPAKRRRYSATPRSTST